MVISDAGTNETCFCLHLMEPPSSMVTEHLAEPYIDYENSTTMIRLTTGIETFLMETLMQALDFKLQLIVAPDGHGILNNGSWSGMIGMVQRKEVDIALGFIGLTSSRFHVVKYTTPYIFDTIKIFSKKGVTLTSKTNILLRAYNGQMWIIILLLLAMAVLILKILCKVAAVKKNYKIIWYVYGSIIFQASNDDLPSTKSTKMFIFFWGIFVMVVVYGFTGMLTSSATVVVQKKRIDTLADLVTILEKGAVGMLIEPQTVTNQLFQDATSEEMKVLRDILRNHPEWMVTNADVYIPMIGTGKYVTVGPSSSREYRAVKRNIGIYMSQESLLSGYGGMILRNDFLFKEIFNKCISRLFASGLFQKWKDKTLMALLGPNNIYFRPPEKAVENPFINIMDIIIVLYVMFTGFVLSLLILFLEHIFYRYNCINKQLPA